MMVFSLQFFFKFLANKPDYEKENSEKGKKPSSRLKLYVPDTIELNDFRFKLLDIYRYRRICK